MKHCASRWYGVLLLAVCTSPVAGQTVKILDWNLYSYNNPSDARYPAMVRIVQVINPDIILFQEADDASGRSAFMTQFASRYPYNYLGAPTNENPRNQILSAYPLSNKLQIFTEDPNGGNFERPTIRADVDILPLAPGTELRVYSAHHKSGTAARDETLKLNQATDDAADITAYIGSNPGARIFYAGDLNAVVGDPSINKLLEPQTTLSRVTILDPINGSPITRPESSKTIDHILRSATLNGMVLTPFIFNTRSYNPPSSVPPPAQPTDSASPVSGENDGTGTITASDHLTLVASIQITPILLNEVLVRHTGASENLEFIEISAGSGQTLTGLAVVIIEGDSDQNPGQVDQVWDLTGQTVPAGGYYALGDTAMAPNFSIGTQDVLENGTQTILLVQGVTVSAGQDIDPNDDGVADVSTGQIKDSVALTDGGGGDRTYLLASVVGPAGSDVPPGAARCPDSNDTDSATDWVTLSFLMNGNDSGSIPSPKAKNKLVGDLDNNCAVNLGDLNIFLTCMTGPNIGPPTGNCAGANLDGDNDADIADFGLLQRYYTP